MTHATGRIILMIVIYLILGLWAISSHADIIKIAQSEIGKGEIGCNNCGSVVKKYTHGLESSWCAGFVSYVLHKAGHDDLGYILSARQYWNKGKRVNNPRAGDVICFWRGSRNGWMGHVGIVESVNGDVITTIEGNTGEYPSVVKRVKYVKGNIKNLLGYVRI